MTTIHGRRMHCLIEETTVAVKIIIVC
jgi:hypothetical protein